MVMPWIRGRLKGESMKNLIVICTLCTGIFLCSAIACETDQYLDGYNWTFHRMNDGNRYHEVKNLGEFSEGDTLNLTAPCMGRHVDTIQVEWEDNHSEVRGELVIMPGNRRLGSRDVTGKHRESWSVGLKMNRFRIEFSGTRGHRCRVRFIRVFYGQNSSQVEQAGKRRVRYVLVDKVSIQGGAALRKARFLRWDGQRVHIAMKTPQGQKVRTFAPGQISQMMFADRWGNAVAKDGGRFPIRIKSMNGTMIQFEKKLNGNVVPKPATDIHNFTSIVFK